MFRKSNCVCWTGHTQAQLERCYFLNDQYIRNIHQPPQPQALHHYLVHQYPQARYVCAYECGKFGYWIQRQFSNLGIECLVLNPADIPSSQKMKCTKQITVMQEVSGRHCAAVN